MPTTMPARSAPGTSRSSSTPAGGDTEEQQIIDGYAALKSAAAVLDAEMKALNPFTPEDATLDQLIEELRAIRDGNTAAIVGCPRPRAVTEVARNIQAARATNIAPAQLIVQDLEDLISWAATKDFDNDKIRDMVVKRKTMLEAVLPEAMAKDMTEAMTLIERKTLRRQYVNSDTMLGDKIEDIPQENFLVTEDNYAWDMSELQLALSTNSGVMRNPLSREMFSEADIRKILAHPLGQSLRPLQLAQDQLKRGVRPTTIERVARLGATMLADDSLDAAPSRLAMDEFLAYVATLPEVEQNTIKSLKIAARDSTSRQPFDYTIAQAVQDAKSNMTCFHKVPVYPPGSEFSVSGTLLTVGP